MNGSHLPEGRAVCFKQDPTRPRTALLLQIVPARVRWTARWKVEAAARVLTPCELVAGAPLATARPTDSVVAAAARGAPGVVGNFERRTRRRDKAHSVAWWRHASLRTPAELAVGFG